MRHVSNNTVLLHNLRCVQRDRCINCLPRQRDKQNDTIVSRNTHIQATRHDTGQESRGQIQETLWVSKGDDDSHHAVVLGKVRE
jgi:hypothetical protein